MSELRLHANRLDDRLRDRVDLHSPSGVTALSWQGIVDRADIELLTEPGRFPSLTRLSLIAHKLDAHGLAPLFGSPLLEQLAELDLTNGAIGDGGVIELVGSPAARGLRALAIGMNALTDASLDAIAASPHMARLERLSLGDASLSDRFAPASDAPLYAVVPPYYMATRFAEQRAPRPNSLTAAGMAVLGAATNMPSLRELGLWAVPDDAGVVALARSPLFARLAALDLRTVTIGPTGEAALLEALPAATALEGINLAHAQVALAGLAVHAAIPRVAARCPRVVIGVRIPDDRVADVLAALAGLRALVSLDVSDSLDGAAVAAVLAGHPGLRELSAYLHAVDAPTVLGVLADHRLARLSLTLCAPGTAGAAAQLAAWPGLAHVSDLSLRGAITDAGAAAILASPHLGPLTRLSLAGCGLGDHSVETLLASTVARSLDSLDLRDNQLSLAGVAAIADATATSLAGLRFLELYGNPVGWHNEEWHDWDGTVVGGELKIDPGLREVMRRIPPRIRIDTWDPR